MSFFNSPDLAWCDLGGTLIFLDIAKDRYYCLAEACNREAFHQLEQAGLGRFQQPACWPKPADWTAPVRTSAAVSNGVFRLPDIARAIWIQRRTERRLTSTSFAATLSNLRCLKDAVDRKALKSRRTAAQNIRAFEHARLLRTAADRCLPRSIALAWCLASDGERTNLVIGVKLAPFSAHCWVQSGNEVLNDSVEEVLRYQPILII
ncbi:lasso peptide biosynthesis B2 protein [Parasphingorhabdus sp. JC815]|uniref:lasso peptide biosynthesis B2 protein n=1 Tax=Parasphingorhabdus sp. JC815 TaxID=3232140 RepID=UPI003459D49B